LGLTPGTRVGIYEVTEQIGAGGMGEVYRATDTNLKRSVAIKVLPASVAGDADRLARFQREAEVLAALNHPNIAAVYGLENTPAFTALVMELIVGEDLSQRIARGAIPLDDALAISKQIADAIGAAHDQGIVHRDLKPANIKLRSDGVVKVLDFGLAKAEPMGVAASALSPTLTSPVFTQVGVILGTAAYMAPEQTRGRGADKRADIWAFGCVLYEMVTGRRAFAGDHITDTLASIVKDEPDLGAAPPRVRQLLRKCFEKDPAKRLRDIGDAWDLLGPDRPAPSPSQRAWVGWSLAGAIAVGAALLVIRMRPAQTPSRQTHLFLQISDQETPLFFALSPDGRNVAVNHSGQLEIRSLDSGDVRTLSSAETPRGPFWSPDSRMIGFFSRAERKLKAIPVAGGVAQTLCENIDEGGAGTWNRDGIIVFSQRGSLARTSAAGGSCSAITQPGAGVVQRYPVFLPDGDHFLYSQSGPDEAQSGVFVGSLRDGTSRRLLPDRSGALFTADAPESRTGHLLFVRERALMAARFDATSLTVQNDPTVVADHVSNDGNGMIAASVDTRGTVAYLRNGRPERQLAWVDRAGTVLDHPIAIGTSAAAVSLSSDGRRAAFVREASGRTALWLHDWQTAQDVVFRTVPEVAVWSADGQRLAFAVPGAGIFIKSANGGAEQQIFQSDHPIIVSDWSRDGRWILYSDIDRRTGADIWLLQARAPGPEPPKPIPLARTPAVESQAQISPDGKWLAYTSDESGTEHVYVRPFTAPAPLPEIKWQASSLSGREPRWRADSRELYYLEPVAIGARRIRMMAVPIETGARPVGPSRQLFEFASLGILPPGNSFLYAPAPDGRRFLLDMFASDARPTFDVILNWRSSERPR
jgi:serine/threonine protein kinase